MPDEDEPKIIADDDWKAEAQREKERLAQEAEKDEAAKEEGEAKGSLFLDLLDLLAQQAVIALGGAQLPDGRTIPSNPSAAKLYVDMIAELEVKTHGNLSKEEAETIKALVGRLRWAFTMAAQQGSAGGPAEPSADPQAAPEPPPPGEDAPSS